MSPSKAKTGPAVNCPCCKGTGKINLSSGLHRILSLVEQGYQTAADVFEHLDRRQDDIQQKAVNKRLELLRTYGLLTRDEQKRGRQWVYRVATG